MGSALKKVTSVFTGHGGEQKQTTTSSANTNSSNMLANNKDYMSTVNKGITEGNNLNIPPYELAQMTPQQLQALQSLQNGVDVSGYKSASDYMQGLGQGLINQGTQGLSQSQAILNKLQGMSQSDYDKGIQSEFNSDLVNEQIAGEAQDLNDMYLKQVQGLNQNATASGNMGSSRAGVAQAALASDTQKNLARASLAYRSQETNNATARFQNYLSLQSNAATTGAQIGSNMLSTGLSGYGAGVNYLTQYNQGTLQNQQNAVNAGNMVRQYNQQQLDVNRQNSLISQSPSLARLAYMNQTLGPIANFSTTGSSTGTQTAYAPGTGSNLLSGIMGTGATALGNYFGFSPTTTGFMSAAASNYGNSYGGSSSTAAMF
ncbi:hypothetical protein FV395_23310 [Salmonella enterica]|nr:hypothetical protein [Salmonella enterica]